MASRVTGVPRPIGISVYDPERSWNGYTVYAGGEIIDMNGNLVKHFDLSQLGKVMPGGHILGDRRYNGPRMERGRELVWEYSALKADGDRTRACRFYSRPWSSAQRLPNGNTLICEGAGGRLFEVTPELEIVWEFISPRETCYRAYRVPYEWIPQLDKPEEIAIPIKE